MGASVNRPALPDHPITAIRETVTEYPKLIAAEITGILAQAGAKDWKSVSASGGTLYYVRGTLYWQKEHDANLERAVETRREAFLSYFPDRFGPGTVGWGLACLTPQQFYDVLSTIDVAKPWFDHLQSGLKRVEGRKVSDKLLALGPGDILTFCCAGDRAKWFRARIVSITRYAAEDGAGVLRRYLEGETLARTLPGIDTIEAAEAVYRGYWPDADETESCGILAIAIVPIAP